MVQCQGPARRGRVRLIILYGGTFDPVHNGHLAVALAAQALFRSDVQLLPCADPPHRPPASASAVQRAEMIELAIAGRPGLHCDRRELRRAGPSYTLLSLREWRDECGPQQPLAWLIGRDAFLGLPDWHDWQALFGLCHFIVADRPGQHTRPMPDALSAACAARWCQDPGELQTAPGGWVFRLHLPLRAESSTAIRAGLAGRRGQAGGHDDLPAPVAAYIARHGLYRSGV